MQHLKSQKICNSERKKRQILEQLWNRNIGNNWTSVTIRETWTSEILNIRNLKLSEQILETLNIWKIFKSGTNKNLNKSNMLSNWQKIKRNYRKSHDLNVWERSNLELTNKYNSDKSEKREPCGILKRITRIVWAQSEHNQRNLTFETTESLKPLNIWKTVKSDMLSTFQSKHHKQMEDNYIWKPLKAERLEICKI